MYISQWVVNWWLVFCGFFINPQDVTLIDFHEASYQEPHQKCPKRRNCFEYFRSQVRQILWSYDRDSPKVCWSDLGVNFLANHVAVILPKGLVSMARFSLLLAISSCCQWFSGIMASRKSFFFDLLTEGCCLFVKTRSDGPTTHREQGDYGVVAGSQVNQVEMGCWEMGDGMESVVDCFGRVLCFLKVFLLFVWFSGCGARKQWNQSFCPFDDGFMIDMLEVNADSCQDCSVVLQGALVIRRVWGLGSYGIYADNPINQGNLGFGQMVSIMTMKKGIHFFGAGRAKCFLDCSKWPSTREMLAGSDLGRLWNKPGWLRYALNDSWYFKKEPLIICQLVFFEINLESFFCLTYRDRTYT